MSPRLLAITLILLLVLGEVGLGVWRNTGIDTSSDPVFSFPPAAANLGKPGKLTPAVKSYGADRGAEWNTTAPDGTQLTVFYFEWDQLGFDTFTSGAGHFTGHPTELCNVAAGFKLKGILPSHSYEVPGQPPLVFDLTHFTDPAGHSVHMFKMSWFQGLGSLPLREVFSRKLRLSCSLSRQQAGAARVLQAGVFDARDADHACQTFRTQVLDQLEW